MLKSFLVGILMAVSAAVTAQTLSPVAFDISMSIYNGTNNTLRYVDVDKTGRLQFIMYGQDPTTTTPQLRPQRRVFGPSIVCGTTFDSTCDVVASAVSIYSAQIQDASAVGRSVLTASDAMAARMALGAGTSSFDGAYSSLTGVPSTFTPTAHTHTVAQISDATVTGRSILTAADASAIRGLIGVPPQFNFGAPTTRSLALSTALQSPDPTKATVTTISPACSNTTSVVASSACTLQVRQSPAAGLTCSTGTVVATWTSTVNLGLVFTAGNGFPFDVKLPIGGYFILCPTAGTFTVAAADQTIN